MQKTEISQEKMDKTVGGLAAMSLVIRKWREERPKQKYLGLDAEMLDDWAGICVDAISLLNALDQQIKESVETVKS